MKIFEEAPDFEDLDESAALHLGAHSLMVTRGARVVYRKDLIVGIYPRYPGARSLGEKVTPTDKIMGDAASQLGAVRHQRSEQ